MSNELTIRVEGLGKRYLIGHAAKRDRYISLREQVGRRIHQISETAMGLVRGHPLVPGSEVEDFWALRDVNFEVRRGEVTGVIGPNGAGKSTLLKILSRITSPSAGRAIINGRVASLLEVGTGFHPELTGRENIFLNGAILGMAKKEVRRKFDEIVAFAEVERFLDTPVKRYSSGMFVRLAFAVAAHLEPEILIVDEVLAVGDAAFQKKCLGKMKEVGDGGRTILFVSHNMAAIESLCSRALLLNSGRLARDGEAPNVVRDHLQRMMADSASFLDAGKTRFIKSIKVLAQSGDESSVFQIGDTALFDVQLFATQTIHQPQLGIGIYTPRGDRIATLHTEIQQKTDWSFSGWMHLRATWRDLPLNAGSYRVDVSLWSVGHELETVTGCISLNVASRDVYGTGRLPQPFQGYLIPDVSWELNTQLAVN